MALQDSQWTGEGWFDPYTPGIDGGWFDREMIDTVTAIVRPRPVMVELTAVRRGTL
jgi:hypothetical protein